MPGHIRSKGKRQDGTTKWEARWRNPLNPRERREKTFRVKSQATRWLADQDTSAYDGTYVDPRKGNQTLNQIASEWRSTWLDLEPKTKAGYENILAKHIEPAFGEQAIQSLYSDQIQRWVSELSQTRQPKTTQNIYGTLRTLLRFAQQRRYIAVNPCDAVRLPRRNTRTKPHLFLTPAEVNQLAAALPQPYDTAVYVAAYCGLRAGELWALRRADVDAIHGSLTVARAFKEIYGRDAANSADHGLIEGPPKSAAARRTITIPGPIRQLLVTYLAHSPLGGSGANDLIFTTANGYPVRHSVFYKRVFKPAVARTWPEGHRLHDLRFHDLRHTCAALSLSVAPNLHVVKQRLGHEDIRTTVNIYGHLLPSVDAALADGLAALFDAAAAPLDNVRALDGSDASEASS